MPQVPFSYCWSPSVVPKPLDWFGNIDVVGYFFLNENTRNPFTPPDDLRAFLAAGPPPVYIGMSSPAEQKVFTCTHEHEAWLHACAAGCRSDNMAMRGDNFTLKSDLQSNTNLMCKS